MATSANYTTCYTFNISTINSTITPNDLQLAYEVGIENAGALVYFNLFGFIYLVLFLWSGWQYGLHGYHKKLWFDNRQVVVVCILTCSLLRSIQFFIKPITDCETSVKWLDELFTAVETIVQFTAFTMLISFWIELQLNVRQGLKSLQKTRTPTIILIGVFSFVRMTEFVFIVLSKDKKNAFDVDEKLKNDRNIFKDLSLVFRVLNVLLYAVVLIIAGYWGRKLLLQLRAFEKRTKQANDRVAKAAAQKLKGTVKASVAIQRTSKLNDGGGGGSSSSGGGGGGGRNSCRVDELKNNTVYGAGSMESVGSFVSSDVDTRDNDGLRIGSTVSITQGYDESKEPKTKIKRNRLSQLTRNKSTSRSRESDQGISASSLAKEQLFHDKVLRMTLFMILEVVVYVFWLVWYGVLFTMRNNQQGKIGNPTTYLSFKYVEKFCEWATIVILCFTMIASSQSRKARTSLVSRRDKSRSSRSSQSSGRTSSGRTSGAGKNQRGIKGGKGRGETNDPNRKKQKLSAGVSPSLSVVGELTDNEEGSIKSQENSGRQRIESELLEFTHAGDQTMFLEGRLNAASRNKLRKMEQQKNKPTKSSQPPERKKPPPMSSTQLKTRSGSTTVVENPLEAFGNVL